MFLLITKPIEFETMMLFVKKKRCTYCLVDYGLWKPRFVESFGFTANMPHSIRQEKPPICFPGRVISRNADLHAIFFPGVL